MKFEIDDHGNVRVTCDHIKRQWEAICGECKTEAIHILNDSQTAKRLAVKI